MKTGQLFNPFRLCAGSFIPEGLARSKGISPGAKLAYGRLVQCAGQDGECYPAVATLASELGVKERQARRYIAELQRSRLIRRVAPLSNSGRTSNAYGFLWHPLLEVVLWTQPQT